MRFVIDQNNDGQFHWRLTGDDGADLAARRRRLRTTRCS
jgi:hypothetical protein